MKNILIFLAVFVLCQKMHLSGASSSNEIEALESRIKALDQEIRDLRLSVNSLSGLHDKLTVELSSFEQKFETQLKEASLPLLKWPERLFTMRAKSYSDLERLNMALRVIKKRLVQKPLQLMADRELRLAEVKSLKVQLEENLFQLEQKQELMSLELDDLMAIERLKAKVPQASGKTKNRIGDIEGGS